MDSHICWPPAVRRPPMETQYNSADYYGFKANLLRGSSVPSSRERWESRLSLVSGVAWRVVLWGAIVSTCNSVCLMESARTVVAGAVFRGHGRHHDCWVGKGHSQPVLSRINILCCRRPPRNQGTQQVITTPIQPSSRHKEVPHLHFPLARVFPVSN